MNKLVALCAAAVLMSVLSDPSSARSPLSRTQPFDEVGKVDHMDLQNGSMVVDDRLFIIGGNVVVTLPGGGRGSLDTLTRGTKIGFTQSPPASARGRAAITHIWVLPKDYVQPASE